MYMATTLQRAMMDRRIRLGEWDKMRITQQPHIELVRAMWCTSRCQTGTLMLVAQREEVKMHSWLWEWANYLE